MKSLRKKDMPLLLVDSGAVLPWPGREQKLGADVSLQAMSSMDYDAINLGISDFSLGVKYLQDMQFRFSIPFVSSNLVWELPGEPWFRGYLIKKVGGLTVGILGVIPADPFKRLQGHQSIKGLHALSPHVALRQVIPKLRKKVDVILLLSQLSPMETKALFHEFGDIDLAIVASKSCEGLPPSGQVKPPTLLCATPKGESLGIALVKQAQDTHLVIQKKDPVQLDDTVAMDPQINALLTRAYRERKMAANKRRSEALHRKPLEGLKLSPEEFMKTLKKGESR